MKLRTVIKLPTYSCEVVLLVVDSVSVEADKLYKKYKLKEDFGDEAEGAVLMLDTDKYYLLIGSTYLSHNTLAHEIYHAVVRVTEDRGIVEEEAQAWLVGHLTGVIYKFLEKKNLTITHGR
jgi:hypothetical protein